MVQLKVRGLAELKAKLSSMESLVEGKGNTYFKAQETRFTEMAKSVVKAIVYDVYKPMEYERTNNLLNSAKASAVLAGQTKMVIYCDPEMTPGVPFRLGGGVQGHPQWYNVYPTYSMDVLTGSGSVGDITGPRNWLPMWKTTFSNIIPKEYHKSVIENTLKQLFNRGQHG